MPRGKKPTPVHVETVCSLCGLDWDKHPDDPTAYDCIELLKAEVAKPRPIKVVPQYPQYPYWWGTMTQPCIEQPLRTTREQPPKHPTIICNTLNESSGMVKSTARWTPKI